MRIPSPVDKIKFRDLEISVKRDDLIDPYISGNKWRKLKYTLEEAKRKDKKLLVSFGGPYSNHLLALAAAAAKFGFKSYAFVRGEQVDNIQLTLCKLFGMQLHFVSREAYHNKKLLFEESFAYNEAAYFIDEGGAGENGRLGCEEIIAELTEDYAHIFCAAGTGTSALGIFHGILRHKLSSKLHVVPVLKNLKLKEVFSNHFPTAVNYIIHESYHFGGYAKVNSELIEFTQEFIRSTGILIDPVYMGKLLYAVVNLTCTGQLNADQKILIIHSGGALGTLGFSEHFKF